MYQQLRQKKRLFFILGVIWWFFKVLVFWMALLQDFQKSSIRAKNLTNFFFVYVFYKILEHYAFLNLGSCSDGHGTIFCIPVRIWTAWMVKSGKCQAKSTITIQPISIGICEIITQNGHNKFSLNIGILTWISIS